MTSSEVPDSPELDLDRGPLLRSTVLALGISTILLVIGAFVTVAWVWELFRTQQHLVGGGFSGGIGDGFGGEPGPSMVDRIDVVFSSAYQLAYAGILVGLGTGLRLLADSTAERLRLIGTSEPEQSMGPDTP